MKPTVYVETTVISYEMATPSSQLVVAAQQQITHQWWEKAQDRFALFVSAFVIREASAGDRDAAGRRMSLLAELPVLELTDEATDLAASLIGKGGIPASAAEDASHIAIAAIHGMDYLVTWNCAHIANAATRGRISQTVHRFGCRCPVICTPQELMPR